MFSHARMSIAHNPFLTKLRAFFVVEFRGDLIERFRGAGGLGKGDSNRFRAELAGTEAVHTAVKVHSEKSSWPELYHPRSARSNLPRAQSGAPGAGN